MIRNEILTPTDGVPPGNEALFRFPLKGVIILGANLQVTGTKLFSYTGGAGKAITKLTGSGTGAAGTLTISTASYGTTSTALGGIPTAITITAGGSGWAVGDTFTIADATGSGFVGRVATVSSGAISTATVVVSNGSTPLTIADVSSQAVVKQSDSDKIKVLPLLQAKYDSIHDATRDPFNSDYLYIPFAENNVPGSVWPLGNVSKLFLHVSILPAEALPFGTNAMAMRLDVELMDDPLAKENKATKRGRVFVQAVYTRETTIAGENTIAELLFPGVSQAHSMILDHPDVEEVQVFIGETRVFNRKKTDVIAQMAKTSLFTVPTDANSAVAMDFFPVMFMRQNNPDLLPVLGDKQGFKVVFKMKEGSSLGRFNILLRGIENDPVG